MRRSRGLGDVYKRQIPIRSTGAEPTQPDDAPEVREISAHAMLIDVRTDPERAQSTIPNSAHLPLNRILAGENPDIARDEVAVIYCASGIRSAQAVHALRERGYSQVVSLRGGINAWLEQQGAS